MTIILLASAEVMGETEGKEFSSSALAPLSCEFTAITAPISPMREKRLTVLSSGG